MPQSHSWQARLCSRGAIRPKSAPSAADSAWMAAKQNITVCMERNCLCKPYLSERQRVAQCKACTSRLQSTGKDSSQYAARGACDKESGPWRRLTKTMAKTWVRKKYKSISMMDAKHTKPTAVCTVTTCTSTPGAFLASPCNRRWIHSLSAAVAFMRSKTWSCSVADGSLYRSPEKLAALTVPHAWKRQRACAVPRARRLYCLGPAPGRAWRQRPVDWSVPRCHRCFARALPRRQNRFPPTEPLQLQSTLPAATGLPHWDPTPSICAI